MQKSRLFTFLIGLIGALFVLSTVPGTARAQQDVLGIAAVVNDDVVSALDLHMRTTMVIATSGMSDTPENRARISPQVLRGLIDEKLMLQEAHRINITVEQKDLDNGLERIAKNNNLTVTQLSDQMHQIGVPLTSLTSRIEAEIAWQLFVGRSLVHSIKIGEEEIADEIKRIQASAGKPEYLLADIYLPVDRPDQDSEVQQVASRLIEQLMSGAAFNALATNFSRSPSAAQGGDMGWVQASHLDVELQSVLAHMKPGTASHPVRTLGGYYIMMLRDVRTSPGLGTGDATMKVSQLHLAASNQESAAALSEQLKNLTQGVSNCAQFEAIGAQSGSPLSGALGEITLSAMPQDMRAVLDILPVGQISTPIATGGGVAVLMVCERNDQGADMDAIRKKISERLTLERLDVSAERHLRDLRRDAFVDIRL